MAGDGETRVLRCCGTTLFSLGRLDVSPVARAELSCDEWAGSLARHAAGVFGDVADGIELENEHAIAVGWGEIRSVFVTASGVQLFVTTAADRSVTRVSIADKADC